MIAEKTIQPIPFPSELSEKRQEQKTVLPGQTPDGQHILSVLLKRSYDIVPGKPCRRAEKDQKLFAADIHYGDPMNSTVQFESDFIPYKQATDIVLNGKAYAPNGNPVRMLTASLMVGDFRKDVLVIGDRACSSNHKDELIVSQPAPFTTMEIRYERAYGGVDIYSDPKMPFLYPRNHLGCGFVMKKTKKTIEELTLPNIEDPNNQLNQDRLFGDHMNNWEQLPMPNGFGWFSKYSQPRASLAGVMPADRVLEQKFRKMYATVLPPEQRKFYEQNQLPDMDFRFFNGASPGLTLPFLKGNEGIRAINLVPEGQIFFLLPGDQPHISLDVGLGVHEPPVVLHTVMIRMEDRQVDLVWRAAATYPGPDWLPEIQKMEVFIK